MANYLMKLKGKYRVLPEIDQATNDFPRNKFIDIKENKDDNIEDADIYIPCYNGSKIMMYGHVDNKKPIWLIGYIPSIGRGHNVIKALKENGIEYIDHIENSEEVEFKFKAADIEIVAELMKAKTSGAKTSVFSTKNLPKSDVEIPTEKIELYKEITSVIPKGDLLIIYKLTNSFLDNILQKTLRKALKKDGILFDYMNDMKTLKMSRQVKEYIYVKGFWDKYLDYLKKELEKIYK